MPAKTSKSLLNRVIVFMVAFMMVLMLQVYVSHYQNRYVILPQQQRTTQIQLISQFLNDVENCMRTLENYRWDYGDAQTMMDQVAEYQKEASQLLSRIDVQLETASEEQYLYANASATTYATFSVLVEDVMDYLRRGEADQASELYYSKVEPCGAYMRQYTQQLLERTIRDSRSTFNRLSRLSEQLGKIQAMIIMLCIVAGTALMASLMTLVSSVRQMSVASQAISQGDLDTPDVDESREDEIGHMARAFNEMKHSMKRQVQTLEEKNEMERTLHKKETEALELQTLMEQEKMQKLRSQVNPHFLFNSLNVILYTAQREGAQKTQSLIGSLSQMFRYTLASNTSLVPLAREVRIVEEFYALNKARFGDRINLRWHISADVDLTETLTPSFLLQPLVENAFRHGLAPKEEGGTVDITIQTEGGNLHIRVADDGVGMTEEALEALRESMEKASDTGEHIGLSNIAARFRLRGEGFRLEIQSQKDHGMQIDLHLPLVLQEEEEEDDD